jgi:uncharacterized protein DUF6642
MARRAVPGLWTMEGAWSSSVRDVRTVRPVLQALRDMGQAKYAELRLNDPEDLLKQMIRWGQAQHSRFGIGYLALHGSPGKVYVGRRGVDLVELGNALPRRGLTSKVLHFGSCAVLDLPSKGRQELRDALGVRALTGFTEYVDWVESLAFELLLFDVLASYKRLDAAEAYIKRNHGAFARRLGFKLVRAPRRTA